MKAVVYHGAGKRAWEEVPDPTILDHKCADILNLTRAVL